MSKMSQLHAELSEQAYDLGYEFISEAEQAGCEVDWEKHKLLPPEEAAHKALLQEKQDVITSLGFVNIGTATDRRIIERAIKFIEQEVK